MHGSEGEGGEKPEGMDTPDFDAEAGETFSLQDRLASKGRLMAQAARDQATSLGDAVQEQAASLGTATQEHIEGAAAAPGDRFQFGAHAGEVEEAGAAQRLDLHEADRLPWLESADDEDEYDEGVDTRRVAIFVVAGLALLAAIVGGIWWGTHRGESEERVADGSVILPPSEPYKQAPANPGGKTYDGTGDSSYAVSQGKNPVPRLAESEDGNAGATSGGGVKSPEEAGAVAMAAAKAAAGGKAIPGSDAMAGNAAPKPAASAAPSAAAKAPGAASGGVGVQVGAYTNQASAEAGWAKLARQYPALAGVPHRVVQGQADIGTVYRLQAVPGGESAANALCAGMKAQGLACQVKR